MRKLQALFAAACFFCLGILGSEGMRAQTKRGVTPEDYLSFKFVGDPHISPDGKVVAYVLTVIDPEKEPARILDLGCACRRLGSAAAIERGGIQFQLAPMES